MVALTVFFVITIMFLGQDAWSEKQKPVSNWSTRLRQMSRSHHHSVHTGSGSTHHSNTNGCDNVQHKDHVNRLLIDWYNHHSYDAIVRFYYDVALMDVSQNAGSLPDRQGIVQGRSDHHSVHDEAYKHGNTVPDIKHVEALVIASQMNAICRAEILTGIEHALHVNTTTTHGHAPTPTPTQALVPTTNMQQHAQTHTCDTVTLLSALVHTDILTNPLAVYCKDGTRSENEALILHACNSPAPAQWRQGAHVLNDCDLIPKYSPIATFLFGDFVTDGTAISGVFVACTSSGIKMAAQLCGHSPRVYNISTGNADPRQDAGSYYVIDW